MAAGFAVGWPDQSIDVEDLAQELVEHWWLRRSKFSPDGPAAMKTVAHTVMRRKLIDLHDKASLRNEAADASLCPATLRPRRRARRRTAGGTAAR
jgi:DNA-directed RNA polymerase specialized sigma24 family protein